MFLKGSSFEHSQLVSLFWKAGRPLGSGKSWWGEAMVRRHWKVNPHRDFPDLGLAFSSSWSTIVSLPYILDAMNFITLFPPRWNWDCLELWAKMNSFFLLLLLWVPWSHRYWNPWLSKSVNNRLTGRKSCSDVRTNRHRLLTQVCGSLWVPLTWTQPPEGGKYNPASSEYKVQAAPLNSFTRIWMELIHPPSLQVCLRSCGLTSPYIRLLSHFTSVCVGFDL